jgi:cation diffusion facilitator CzcD-associated flavoprotein CzcO
VSWRVVIAGGGFGGLYVARALADWNVALAFGRDTSSPGRLGTPTPLESE